MSTWLDKKRYRYGATVTPQTLYDLGAEWYANRFDRDFAPLSAAAKQALFEKYELRGEFWSFGG